MSERISSIDTVRGVALLGLLTMNLVAMSMPMGAYLNPFAFRSDDVLNYQIFSLFYIFCDQKFMGMFSLLFGASVVLLVERLDSSGRPALRTHYVRNGWLLLIGLLHGIFLWEGDVLVIYAFAALFLYPLRNSSPAILLTLAIVAIAMAVVFATSFNIDNPAYTVEGRRNALEFYAPSDQSIADTIAKYQSGYTELLALQLNASENWTAAEGDQFLSILSAHFFRALGMMFLGMVLYRLGFLQGRWSRAAYFKTIKLGAVCGLFLIVFGWYQGHRSGWAYAQFNAPLGMHSLNIIGTVFLVLAYVSAIVLWCQGEGASKLKRRLQAVGQTALSNYLAQSLIGTSLFYGYGLGWFGGVSRWQLVLIMFCIWALQLWFAKFWLQHFRQGPVEYIWRCLSYFNLPPLRR
ncbi:MAG: DUF418 domain-containing protein [Cellvibrionaceae bacterium]|nr:DUF418 domain-containing protein [Cellvibrionaceae bacterium]